MLFFLSAFLINWDYKVNDNKRNSKWYVGNYEKNCPYRQPSDNTYVLYVSLVYYYRRNVRGLNGHIGNSTAGHYIDRT